MDMEYIWVYHSNHSMSIIVTITNEVSQPCSSTCSWRALIADLVHPDDCLWEEIRRKPWFQYGGEDYGNHYN